MCSLHRSLLASVLFVSTFVWCCAAAPSCDIDKKSWNPRSTAVDKVGWFPSPNQRGTLDIVWNCGLTLFLCCWSTLCLNIPSQDDSKFTKLKTRILLSGLCCLGPEFLFQIALGQLISARVCLRSFHESFPESKDGEYRWTITHSYYADMGGFHLDVSTMYPPKKSFPMTGQQLLYLIKQGYVQYPQIKAQDIQDCNKKDSILRVITALQIIWFVVNIVGRRAQGLAITSLELTTSAFIFCALATMLVWWDKPADVQMVHILQTSVSLTDILNREGVAEDEVYKQTPLDFIDRKEWSWSLYWNNWVMIMKRLGVHWGADILPVKRFQNTVAKEIKGWWYGLFSLVSGVYLAIFLTAWNSDFPTGVERLLWRVASTTALACLPAIYLVSQLNFVWRPAISLWLSRSSLHKQRFERILPAGGKRRDAAIKILQRIADRIRNNSIPHDPAMSIPLGAILPMYVLGPCYCFSRLYIWLSDVIELRSLPLNAYSVVTWTKYMPHF